jgi:hypothetical protein
LFFDAFDNTSFSDQENLDNTIRIKDNRANHLLISKVYPDVDDCHGEEAKNEWWEIFNPTGSTTEMKDWQICNQDNCRIIHKNFDLAPDTKVFISHDHSTWRFYKNSTSTYDNLGAKFFNMDRLNDMATLLNPEGVVVDQLNWGSPATNWENFNEGLWPVGVVPVEEGHVIGREAVYLDTDTPGDFIDLGVPECIDGSKAGSVEVFDNSEIGDGVERKNQAK